MYNSIHKQVTCSIHSQIDSTGIYYTLVRIRFIIYESLASLYVPVILLMDIQHRELDSAADYLAYRLSEKLVQIFTPK